MITNRQKGKADLEAGLVEQISCYFNSLGFRRNISFTLSWKLQELWLTEASHGGFIV